jgi:succinoglycan biosynthesis protein ExoA
MADFVTVLMPAYNEEQFVERAIASVLPASNEIECEVLVVDGGSSDRTPDLVRQFSQRDPRVKLLINPRRIQAISVNLGVSAADSRSTVIVRADCHAEYPDRYLSRILEAFDTTDAVSVVVPMISVGSTCFGRAVAAAQNSWLGNGGSLHRRKCKSQFVEHGHHAGFYREHFTNLGGYDENFAVNEDAELDIRIRRNGGKIWLASEAVVTYYTRDTARALATQYMRYGVGRARTAAKHRNIPRLRQVLPLAAGTASFAGVSLAPFYPLSLGLPIAYISACVFLGVLIAFQRKSWCALASGPAAIIMHLAWSFGFSCGLYSALVRERRVLTSVRKSFLPPRPTKGDEVPN